jgi:hypothetical protein
MTTTRYTIGAKTHLPDGGEVTLTAISEGTEHGDPVLYLTGTTSLGNEITRWVRRPAADPFAGIVDVPTNDAWDAS